jgi:hypothetical protein
MGYAIKTHSHGFLILTFSALPGDPSVSKTNRLHVDMHDSDFLYQNEAYTINSSTRLANLPVTLGFGPVNFQSQPVHVKLAGGSPRSLGEESGLEKASLL